MFIGGKTTFRCTRPFSVTHSSFSAYNYWLEHPSGMCEVMGLSQNLFWVFRLKNAPSFISKKLVVHFANWTTQVIWITLIVYILVSNSKILNIKCFMHILNTYYISIVSCWQPRPQALFGQRRYGGKTGSARDDGPEALRDFSFASIPQRLANRALSIP